MDDYKNHAKVTVSGVYTTETSVNLATGSGAKLPTAPFNMVWWNSTDYPDPADDPYVEIVRVTSIIGDSITVTRGEESTAITSKNLLGKTYKMVAPLTAKCLNIDIPVTIADPYNLGFGGGSMAAFASSGSSNAGNLAVGVNAMAVATSGWGNTAVGYSSLAAWAGGTENTTLGTGALAALTTGNRNVAIGFGAMALTTTSSFNMAVGYTALNLNTTGELNTAVGYDALQNNTTGNWNTGFGFQPLDYNTTGSFNVALGFQPSLHNISGNRNLAVGFQSLFNNLTGGHNSAAGLWSLYVGTNLWYNTAFGEQSLRNTTANGNTAFGHLAGNINTSGSYNTYMGYNADAGGQFTNSSAIGANATTHADNTMVLGNKCGVIIGRLTTAEKNALSATNGMIVYDTDLNKFQGYEGGSWANLI